MVDLIKTGENTSKKLTVINAIFIFQTRTGLNYTKKNMRQLKSCQKKLIKFIEHLFYHWGKIVATYPWTVIIVTTLLTAFCCLGFLLFRIQYRADHLWIPSTSSFKEKQEWKNENFKKHTRYQNVIFRSVNILTPAGIKQILNIHLKMLKFSFEDSTFEDFCLKVPVQNLFSGGERKYKREIRKKTFIEHNHGNIQDALFFSGKLEARQIFHNSSVENGYRDEEVEDDIEYEDGAAYDDYDIWDNYPQYDTTNNTDRVPEDISEALAGLPRDEYCDLITNIDMACY